MKNQEGQSLVEMIVIVGMVVLLVMGIIVGTTTALSRSQTSRTRSTALSLAQAGIELARQQRDSGWTAFAAKGTPSTTYCVGDFVTVPPCPINIQGTFTRTVTLEFNAASGMKVTSRVVWADTTNPLNAVQLTTYLTQWR